MLIPEDPLRVEIALNRLIPTHENVRRVVLNVGKLAGSIKAVGLLQNLVVSPTNDEQFIVECGERRRRALLLLVQQGEIPPNFPVPCYITRADRQLVNIAENTSREDVPIWHLGLRFISMMEAGYSGSAIADGIGKTRSYVSQCKALAEGLHPNVIPILDKFPYGTITFRDLRSIARLTDDDGSPSEEKQSAKLRAITTVTKRTKSDKQRAAKTTASFINKRLSNLEGMALPPIYDSAAQAIIKYLRGETKNLEFE